MTVHLTLEDVLDLALEALVACGALAENARPVAESIRDAEADGIRNVGLNYLPHYCGHLRCGKVDGKVKAILSHPTPSVLLCDARHGFAHTAYVQAFEPFVAATRQNGVSSLAIRNSYAAGVIGWYVEQLAEQSLVALAYANSPAAIAPWGGKQPFFGTNPLAFAIPRRDHPPLIIDQSSSTTAKVNVVEAAQAGQSIPDTWALDRHGKPTTDAKAGLEGSMAPAGGYKGVALAMIVDLLAGGLAGPSMSYNAAPFGNNTGGPPEVGQLFVAFDPDAFSPDFAHRSEMMLSAMIVPDGVRLPGDRRHRSRIQTSTDGVWLDDNVYQKLKAYCRGE